MRLPSSGCRAWGSAAAIGGALALLGAGPSVAADATPDRETIVFVRHGEKPEQGLGQLSCQGFNRALALPAVIEAKFGRPDAIFVPDPSQQKNDGGRPYDYVRPLATLEPAAIAFALPINADFGFREVDKLRAALERPAYSKATVVVAWEHKLIDLVAKQLMASHGGDETAVPKWHSTDFDGIYVVTISSTSTNGKRVVTAAFHRDQEGLDGRPTACPK